MDAVAALGCIVADEACFGPVRIHHVRHGTSRRDHMRVLPLCDGHHQYGGPGVAIHASKVQWRARYGMEDNLLQKVEQLLA